MHNLDIDIYTSRYVREPYLEMGGSSSSIFAPVSTARISGAQIAARVPAFDRTVFEATFPIIPLCLPSPSSKYLIYRDCLVGSQLFVQQAGP